MYFVYVIISINHPEQLYIGYTTDINKRLLAHNAGKSTHTAKYKPWKLVIYLAFEKEESALSFEKYLKTQSGRAFIKKRFL